VGAGFDDVGVDGALSEEAGVFDALGLGFEDFDESVADDDALLLWIGDAGEAVEKEVFGLGDAEVDLEVAAENLFDHFRFVEARRPLLTKTQVSWSGTARCRESGEDGGIDAAGEAADDAAGADLGADGFDLPPRRRSRSAIGRYKRQTL